MSANSVPATPLTISIKKKPDGSAALSCTRADGSVTWQRQEGRQGRFFPLHDLTHYAVETVLGLERAFYGLVAAGWNLTDFGKPWPRGPIPPDAGAAELIVGFLDTERASGTAWSAADFNDKAVLYHQARGGTPLLELTEDDLHRIRAARRQLFDRWDALPAGAVLELPFPPDGR
jgi:hypothetical protein